MVGFLRAATARPVTRWPAVDRALELDRRPVHLEVEFWRLSPRVRFLATLVLPAATRCRRRETSMGSAPISQPSIIAGVLFFGGSIAAAWLMSAVGVGLGGGGGLVSTVTYAFGLLLLPAAFGAFLVKRGSKGLSILRTAAGASSVYTLAASSVMTSFAGKARYSDWSPWWDRDPNLVGSILLAISLGLGIAAISPWPSRSRSREDS